FYEGPPTANGSPGIHHVEARAFKDLIPRYKTMRGFHVPRKAGWDTHGLPVEIQVEKELGLKIKQDIETYGIAPFNAKAKESVWRYKEEWDRLTKRMGFWLDLEHPYITYDPFYMESLWWIIKEFWNKKLLVEDFKVLPWCTRCQTGLSTHEMAQGYRVTKDLSVFVKFPISNFQFPNQLRTPNPKVFILSWTTTPWTLPGNVALAINPKLEYLIVADLPRAVEDNESGVVTEVYIFAKDAVGHGIRGDVLSELLPDYGNIVMLKKPITECSNVIATIRGDKLIGLSYKSLFQVSNLKSATSYKVYAADFVTAEDGTGVVHTAVMYGEDDYKLGKKIGLPIFHTVDETGKFFDFVPEVGGLSIIKGQEKDKETEQRIIDYLKKYFFPDIRSICP
ncbi:MAG: class I tRNA ligase family protein, partial [Patescibacteria group bacterium]